MDYLKVVDRFCNTYFFDHQALNYLRSEVVKHRESIQQQVCVPLRKKWGLILIMSLITFRWFIFLIMLSMRTKFVVIHEYSLHVWYNQSMTENPNINNLDLNKIAKRADEIYNENIRRDFAPYIKQSALIKLKEDLMMSPGFRAIYLDAYGGQIKSCFTGGTVDYDVAANIAMIHWYQSLRAKDEKEIYENLKNSNYINELMLKAIEQCKLRKIILPNMCLNQVSHVPIVYYMKCLSILLTAEMVDVSYHKAESLKIPNQRFKFNCLFELLYDMNAIIDSITNGNYGPAYVMLRTALELLIIYYVARDDEELSKEYYRFMDLRATYGEPENYPQDFRDNAPKRGKNQNIPYGYYNLGWIRKLDKEDNFNYTFKDLVSCAPISDEDKSAWQHVYTILSSFVHANYISKEKEYIDILSTSYYAAQILYRVSTEITQIYGYVPMVGDINVTESLLRELMDVDSFIRSTGGFKNK